jgi:hypothetical protein
MVVCCNRYVAGAVADVAACRAPACVRSLPFGAIWEFNFLIFFLKNPYPEGYFNECMNETKAEIRVLLLETNYTPMQ